MVKQRISLTDRIRLIEYNLKTGKYGYIAWHGSQPTFLNYINRSTEYDYSLDFNIKENDNNRDVDNLLILASEFLRIPVYMADRAKFLLAKTWNHAGQKENYNNMTYEMAALGILMYCCEDISMPESAFEEYVKLLYPRLNPKTNLNQIKPKFKNLTRAYNKIKELCAVKETDSCFNNYLTASDKIELLKNYRLSHGNLPEKFNKVEIIRKRYQMTFYVHFYLNLVAWNS